MCWHLLLIKKRRLIRPRPQSLAHNNTTFVNKTNKILGVSDNLAATIRYLAAIRHVLACMSVKGPERVGRGALIGLSAAAGPSWRRSLQRRSFFRRPRRFDHGVPDPMRAGRTERQKDGRRSCCRPRSPADHFRGEPIMSRGQPIQTFYRPVFHVMARQSISPQAPDEFIGVKLRFVDVDMFAANHNFER